ncbi:alcohol dehydrogenase catalytic domain-containing protein [Nocardia gipuzkoensis]|uniref:alcohol dehydrogenase catalytic domain-containing protein n=1 Tax=Nocardia gipuzkoensis TaxID=2749991 RepID=UPI003EDFAF06
MAETMRALVGGAGPDWEIRELAVPTPGPGQILVRVRAAGVNRADLYMLEGSYNPNSKTSNVYPAGLEMAGEVAAIGAGVTDLQIGDRVGGAGLGGFATYAGRIRPVVDRVFGFDEAKAVAEYMRSYQATGKVVLEIP